jgi:hypothetical protein
MAFSPSSLQELLAKNKAEELGHDVWRHFVVPPFYDRLDLHTARKPRLIIGGRGCGKTMLLRYLCHQTVFSPHRERIPDTALSHIGLYWRANTQFANAMNHRGIHSDVWASAFGHFAALVLGLEVLGSLESIAASASSELSHSDLTTLRFDPMQAFDDGLPSLFGELRSALEERLWQFESWVSDVRKAQEPKFLPDRRFVLALIKVIQRQLPLLASSSYAVYLDEYENLSRYQQEIINTWLKHSEVPLIFNLAMKRHGFDTRKTVGAESLSDVHDFRQHDLESYFVDDESFPIFAAEILFLQLSLPNLLPVPIDVSCLRDPDRLPERRAPSYRKQVLDQAARLLPDLTEEQLAQSVFSDKALARKLRERIQTALRRRRAALNAALFYRPHAPQASIITPALLSRPSTKPAAVAAELANLEQGRPNSFTGPTGWIHNNFIGCLLQIYEPHSRACPFYAGFRTFIHLSHGNIRHFIELCHKSMYRALNANRTFGNPIPPDLQAEAARQASTAFLGEVRTFGARGLQLHTFVLRLGSLFALAHQRPTQSESEQSHFSVRSGRRSLRMEDEDFMREALKWSVLFETKGTKKKDDELPEDTEYVLNPIYAPYFHISYRKKRRLELRSDELLCLIRGTYDEVTALLKRYSRAWLIEPAEMTPTLFSHLED